MKKVVLYYLYLFIALDMVMGFTLIYLGLQKSLLINPGQLVRSIILLLLLGDLLTDAWAKLNRLNGVVLLAILYFVFYVLVIFLKNNPAGMWFIELNNVSKLIFLLLLIYYVNKHKSWFLARIDKIMIISFGLLTLNLFIGFFGGAGISTYGAGTSATKGLLYGGNAVSVLSLVYFIYYFFNIQDDSKAKYLAVIAIFDIYIVGTKTIFIVPVVMLVYLFTKIKWTATKIIISIAIIVPLVIAGIIVIAPIVTQIFQARYLNMLQRTGIVAGNTPTAPGGIGEAILAYRRVAFAVTQLQYQFQHAGGVIFGYGSAGQHQFWTDKNFFYTFAAMDFFDFLFEYGVVGSLLFYTPIFYAFYRVIKHWEFTPVSVSFIFIFLYSFFGGYVIYGLTAGTMFAFLTALNLPEQERITEAAEKTYVREVVKS